jgi:hypothetical protein
MSAREDILHLLNSYGFILNTGDLHGFASLFEHGSWEMEGATPIIGKQEALAALSNVKILRGRDAEDEARDLRTSISRSMKLRVRRAVSLT